jgi:hypothetical protein
LRPVTAAQLLRREQLGALRETLRITLPRPAHAELADSLRRTLAESGIPSASFGEVAGLASRRSFDWGDFAKAVSAAGLMSAAQGHREDARELQQVASRMTRITTSPSGKNVEALLENVVASLGRIECEIKGERQEQVKRESEREKQEQSRFVITIDLVITLFLLEWLLRTSPPPQ